MKHHVVVKALKVLSPGLLLVFQSLAYVRWGC